MQHVERRAVLDHRVEDLVQQLRVDQVPLGLDDLAVMFAIGHAFAPRVRVKIGRLSGRSTIQSSEEISASARSTNDSAQGSSVVTNGTRSFECSGNCRTASRLIACRANAAPTAAMIPGRSRTVKRT